MSGVGYTVPAIVAVLAVGVLEFTVLRTGLFRRPAYWLSMLIVIGFQILVDGWLTKLSAPIVVYDNRQTSGIRSPLDIPIEDFFFAFFSTAVAQGEILRSITVPPIPSGAGVGYQSLAVGADSKAIVRASAYVRANGAVEDARVGGLWIAGE